MRGAAAKLAGVAAIAALCALLGAIHSSGSTASPVRSVICGRPSGQTLASDARGRVYSLPTGGKVHEIAPESLRILGCATPGALPRLLGLSGFIRGAERDNEEEEALKASIDTDAVTVSSPSTAYASTFMGIDFNRTWIVVRNLSTGEVERTHRAGPSCGVESISSPTDIAVTRRGAVAWISRCDSLGTRHSARQVAAIGPTGDFAVLDDSAEIDLRSLELRGGRVHWTDAGSARSAPFP